MGTWGISPFENDEGCDFASEIFNEKKILKILNKKSLTDWEINEVRAMTEIIVNSLKIYSGCASQQLIDKLSQKLQLILDDTTWFDTWYEKSDAVKVKKQIKKNLKILRNI